MAQRAKSRNLFGWLTKKKTTYTRSRGEASHTSQAYRAGVKSGDTAGFDSWLTGKRLQDAPRETRKRLEAQYRRGVDRAGAAERVTAARKAKAADKREAKRRHVHPVTYKGVRISPYEDGFRLSRIDKETVFDTVTDAKDFIAAEKNPCARTRKTHVTDRAKRYRANQPGCRPGGVKKCKLCPTRTDLMVDHVDGDESNGKKNNLRWLCRSCNTALGAQMAAAGIGRRTLQYNPTATGGASNIYEYMLAVLQHTRGAHDAGGKIIHNTPKAKRRQWAADFWTSRKAHARSSSDERYYSNPGPGFVKSRGHLFIKDGVEWFQAGNEIYRAPLDNVIDVETGYRIGRWEFPVHQLESRKRQGVYPFSANPAAPPVDPFEAGAAAAQMYRGINIRPDRTSFLNAFNKWKKANAGTDADLDRFTEGFRSAAAPHWSRNYEPKQNPRAQWGFGVFAQDTRSAFQSSDQVAWFKRAKPAKTFADEYNAGLKASGEWYSQTKPHYHVRKDFDRTGASSAPPTPDYSPGVPNPTQQARESMEYNLGYSLGQRDRDTATLRRRMGELKENFAAKFTPEHATLGYFVMGYDDGYGLSQVATPAANPGEWITVEPVHGYDFEAQQDVTIPRGTVVVPTGNASDKSEEFRLPSGRLVDVRFALAKRGIKRRGNAGANPESGDLVGQRWEYSYRKWARGKWRTLFAVSVIAKDDGQSVTFADGRTVPHNYLVHSRPLANPEEGAEDGAESEEKEQARKIAELFHGRPVKEEITVTEQLREHDWFWRIGPLVELKVRTLTKKNITIPFHQTKEGMVHLFCSPDGRQFYLRGGDQELALDPIGMGPKSQWFRDRMIIGEATEITYRDKKKFHKFKLTEYYHKLGEVTNEKPALAYDSLAARLEIIGGQYKVETEELVDGMSPGIVN